LTRTATESQYQEIVRRLGLLLAILLAACGGTNATPGASSAADAVRVVTTSNVFADMVRKVGGERVSVTSLVPKGADIHTYQATPQDLRAVASADLFVMNGLGLDDWLEGTITSASSRAPIVKLGVDLPGVAFLPGETASTANPHLWMDVSYAMLYATRIADALRSADAAHAGAIGTTFAAYMATLQGLDAWVRGQVGAIPAANRKIVTFHPALAYYARAYGIDVVGVAVTAPGQDPSAGEIATLIDAIRASGARAIFSESQFPTTLVDQLARETGARVVATLYDDTLGNDPVTSYEALIRWDTDQIVTALK
jgi:ABC-type Zn uptake system ZnuABC Zn-binding protein ZnuA